MSPTGTLFHLHQLTATLASASGAGVVLQRIAERVRRITRAEGVYIERAGSAVAPAEVVATTGDPAPAPGSLAPHEHAQRLRVERVQVVDGDGAVLGAIVVLHRAVESAPARRIRRLALLIDVTRLALHVSALADQVERRRVELGRAIDEKFRLISGITYELKETLGVAAEYVQLLDTETELTERQRHYIESGRRTMTSAVRLIGDLLELARVEAGRLPVQREPTSMGAMLRDMVRDYRLASATYGVAVSAQVPAGLPLVHTDPDLVGRILENLLSNAVRYTPANGRIQVAAEMRDALPGDVARRWLCITVSDSGPGVQDADDVFEAVERVSRRTGSPGFRLAISRNIARLLGGDLTLESGREAGASFRLWLPMEA